MHDSMRAQCRLLFWRPLPIFSFSVSAFRFSFPFSVSSVSTWPFFRDYRRAPCGQFTLSLCPQLQEEISYLDVLADLVGNFCSFFESKRTESETALTYLDSPRSLALGRTHDRLGSHAHNSTKFSWKKFSWSEVKSRNSRKYCATKIWSYTV